MGGSDSLPALPPDSEPRSEEISLAGMGRPEGFTWLNLTGDLDGDSEFKKRNGLVISMGLVDLFEISVCEFGRRNVQSAGLFSKSTNGILDEIFFRRWRCGAEGEIARRVDWKCVVNPLESNLVSQSVYFNPQ